MKFEKIKNIAGKSGFIDNPAEMDAYTKAWRGGWVGKTPLVVFPSSTEQVSQIVKICAAEKIAIVPQGGNTGLVGGAIPSQNNTEIVMSMAHMNKIREINKNAFTMTAEAGCILANMQSAAREAGRLFPISIASEGSAQAGGIVATNAGGTSVLRYGTTRNIVLGIEVVLPNGEILNELKTLRKDNTGYDLKNIFIGSEGTLGIITAANFKLFPLPKQTETLFLAINDVDTAVELLAIFREKTGDLVSAFEIISENSLALVEKHMSLARTPFAKLYPYHLLVEISSSVEGDFLRSQVENILEKEINSGKIIDAIIAESLSHAKDLWYMREHISEAEKKEGRGIHFDISLPIDMISSFMKETDELTKKAVPEMQLVAFGHIGDGNIHYNMCLPMNTYNADFSIKKMQLKEIVYEQLKKRGGSISAEHGVGQERREDLKNYKTATEINLMKRLKAALDPLNIMNPGKIT